MQINRERKKERRGEICDREVTINLMELYYLQGDFSDNREHFWVD